MQNAGSVCCCMPGCLVQSPDTHHRGVATRVCPQHLGSHGRFAQAPRIFGNILAGRLTAGCSFQICTPFRVRQSRGDVSMASSAGARKKQEPSGDHDNADSTIFSAPASDFQYGTAALRVSDINISDSDLPQVTNAVHIARVAYELYNKLGNQYSWVLLLAPSHSPFLTSTERARCEAN